MKNSSAIEKQKLSESRGPKLRIARETTRVLRLRTGIQAGGIATGGGGTGMIANVVTAP